MWPIIGIIVGLSLTIKGIRNERLRKKIVKTSTSEIRSVMSGIVELSGIGHSVKPLLDPIYNQPCVYYSVQVSELSPGFGGRKRMYGRVLYQSDTKALPFYLKDKTGQVLVIPLGAEILGGMVINQSSDGMVSLGILDNDPVIRFLKSKSTGGSMKTVEARIIREGFPVYVLGYAKCISQSQVSSSGVSTAEAARKLKKDAERMSSLDSNRDGEIDSFEWDAGLTEYKKELEEKIRSENQGDTGSSGSVFTLPIVITKGPKKLFVIADTEEDVRKALGRSAVWQVIVGPVLAALSSLFLFNFFR
jgi:hypothetical protein